MEVAIENNILDIGTRSKNLIKTWDSTCISSYSVLPLYEVKEFHPLSRKIFEPSSTSAPKSKSRTRPESYTNILSSRSGKYLWNVFRKHFKLISHGNGKMLHEEFWLEKIDKKHRYGYNLRQYHRYWIDLCSKKDHLKNTNQRSFFSWLDSLHNQHLDLPSCSYKSLEEMRVIYLSKSERLRYKIKFHYSNTKLTTVLRNPDGTLFNTTDVKWIFVMDDTGNLYINKKQKGYFHHSSFLSGCKIKAAGKITITDGVINSIEPHSGHYKPKLSELTEFCSILASKSIDLSKILFIRPKKWNEPWPFTSTIASSGSEEYFET